MADEKDSVVSQRVMRVSDMVVELSVMKRLVGFPEFIAGNRGTIIEQLGIDHARTHIPRMGLSAQSLGHPGKGRKAVAYEMR